MRRGWTSAQGTGLLAEPERSQDSSPTVCVQLKMACQWGKDLSLYGVQSFLFGKIFQELWDLIATLRFF